MQGNEMTVAELVSTHPAATRVLYRHGIEFCAGGSRRLSEACREAAVAVDAVLAEVAREEAASVGEVEWSSRPLPELVDHLVDAVHAAERPQMAELERLLSAKGIPDDLVAAFARLRVELSEHMDKEETVLFPWLRSGRGDLARTPIQVMLLEHDATLRLLNHVRALRLAAGAALPPGVAERLSGFDRHLREHMHLENNLLFPRALRGEE